MPFWMLVLRFVPKINQAARFVPAWRLYFCGSEIYGERPTNIALKGNHYDNNGKEKIVSYIPLRDILVLSLVPAFG